MTIDDKLLSLREEIEIRERKLSHELVKGRENLYPYCLWQRDKEEYEQIADWLEELKELRLGVNYLCDRNYKQGRNDAIEEFVNLYEEFCNSDISCGDISCVGKFCARCFKENYMEKLKEGAE